MPFNHVAQISAWLAAAGIDEFDLTGPSARLCLRLDAGQVVVAEPPDSEPVAQVIPASSVGIFLHRHPMSDVPLAPVGSEIRAGQIVGLLRIGALLLPVAASAAGTITAVPAPHETTVGYGDALIVYRVFDN